MSEIKTFEEFAERALNFDFYTDFSDDHRVWAAGERARAEMNAFAATNELAAKLWDHVRKANTEGFMAGQLSRPLNALVLEGGEEKVAELKRFMLDYMASTGSDTLLGKAIRDDIARKIGAPYSYQPEQREKRDQMIDEFIKNA